MIHPVMFPKIGTSTTVSSPDPQAFHESQKEYNIRFLSTSNIAPPLEMLDGIVEQLEYVSWFTAPICLTDTNC